MPRREIPGYGQVGGSSSSESKKSATEKMKDRVSKGSKQSAHPRNEPVPTRPDGTRPQPSDDPIDAGPDESNNSGSSSTGNTQRSSGNDGKTRQSDQTTADTNRTAGDRLKVRVGDKVRKWRNVKQDYQERLTRKENQGVERTGSGTIRSKARDLQRRALEKTGLAGAGYDDVESEDFVRVVRDQDENVLRAEFTPTGRREAVRQNVLEETPAQHRDDVTVRETDDGFSASYTEEFLDRQREIRKNATGVRDRLQMTYGTGRDRITNIQRETLTGDEVARQTGATTGLQQEPGTGRSEGQPSMSDNTRRQTAPRRSPRASPLSGARTRSQQRPDEQFGDIAVGVPGTDKRVEDYLRSASSTISDVTKSASEKAAPFVTMPAVLASGSENNPVTRTAEGALYGGAQLANVPQVALGLKEGVELGVYGAEKTASGQGGQAFEEAVVAGFAATDQAKQAFSENPYRTVGTLGGSLLFSAGAMSKASQVSSRAGTATRYAIQPGEEIATSALNRVAPASVKAKFPGGRIDNEEIVIQKGSAAAKKIYRTMSGESSSPVGAGLGSLAKTEAETESETDSTTPETESDDEPLGVPPELRRPGARFERGETTRGPSISPRAQSKLEAEGEEIRRLKQLEQDLLEMQSEVEPKIESEQATEPRVEQTTGIGRTEVVAPQERQQMAQRSSVTEQTRVQTETVSDTESRLDQLTRFELDQLTEIGSEFEQRLGLEQELETRTETRTELETALEMEQEYETEFEAALEMEQNLETEGEGSRRQRPESSIFNLGLSEEWGKTYRNPVASPEEALRWDF